MLRPDPRGGRFRPTCPQGRKSPSGGAAPPCGRRGNRAEILKKCAAPGTLTWSTHGHCTRVHAPGRGVPGPSFRTPLGRGEKGASREGSEAEEEEDCKGHKRPTYYTVHVTREEGALRRSRMRLLSCRRAGQVAHVQSQDGKKNGAKG